MQRAPQRIEPSDLVRLRVTLDQLANKTPAGARLRALVVLAHIAALNLSDVLALDFRGALSVSAPHRWTVGPARYITFLRGHRADPVQMPSTAVHVVEAWVRAAAREHRLQWPPAPGIPLFHTLDRESRKLVKLSPRTVQSHFAVLQREADTAAHYRFSDLRHDAIVRFAEKIRSVTIVAQYARISPRSALAYLPAATIATLAELDPS